MLKRFAKMIAVLPILAIMLLLVPVKANATTIVKEVNIYNFYQIAENHLTDTLEQEQIYCSDASHAEIYKVDFYENQFPNDNRVLMGQHSTISSSQKYSCSVNVTPKSGYAFDSNTRFYMYDQYGNQYPLTRYSSTSASVVLYTAAQYPRKEVKECYITGETMVRTSETPSTHEFTAKNSTTWEVVNYEFGGYNKDGNYHNPNSNEYFKKDYTYYPFVYLEMIDTKNYTCASSIKVYLNNEYLGYVDSLYETIEVDLPGQMSFPFVDVATNQWYFKWVRNVSLKNLMTGLDDTHFGPTNTLVRAQFAVVLYRMAGSPSVTYTKMFNDVPGGAWFSNAITWAKNKGIVAGYSNGNFGINDTITREQMCIMMYKYAISKGYSSSTNGQSLEGFKDGNQVSGWAADAVKWCVNRGILSGKDNGTRLAPQDGLSRAECASIISRFVENF